jgi:hypothetical protein
MVDIDSMPFYIIGQLWYFIYLRKAAAGRKTGGKSGHALFFNEETAR